MCHGMAFVGYLCLSIQGDEICTFAGLSGMLIQLLTMAAHCPRGVHSLAGDGPGLVGVVGGGGGLGPKKLLTKNGPNHFFLP